MTRNVKLAHRVLDEIENQKFQWEQNVWVQGEPVDNPEEDVACGTACCYAGRVGLISDRKPVYRPTGDGRYILDEDHMVPLEGEEGDYTHSGRYFDLFVPENGTFVRYEGELISYERAAKHDLGITWDEASNLFDEDNALEDLQELVDEYFPENSAS